jgi:ribosomal protein S18 acetylase RimI-like enzyme
MQQLEFTSDHARVDWPRLRQDLIDDDFHNGRTVEQLRMSFQNSQIPVYVLDGDRCIGTARALSDHVCNCYVIDVWTHSDYRQRGVATEMMNLIKSASPGQHIYLFTDDAVDFYRKLGFEERPIGMEIVSGTWLQNGS